MLHPSMQRPITGKGSRFARVFASRVLLPGPFVTRLLIWVLLTAVCPFSGTGNRVSFRLEVRGGIRPGTDHPVESAERHFPVSLTDRVLARLEQFEKHERDPWLRDDIRISWITVLWAARGVPVWCWHRNDPPHVAATFQVLNLHPDKVWPTILARRAALLGKEQAKWRTSVNSADSTATATATTPEACRNLSIAPTCTASATPPTIATSGRKSPRSTKDFRREAA